MIGDERINEALRRAVVGTATVLSMLVIPAAVAAATLPSQFDLVCQIKGVSGPLPIPHRIRLDLASGKWCLNDCATSHAGAAIEGTNIVLEVKNRQYDTGYKSTEIQTINVDTLDYFGVSEAKQGSYELTHQTLTGDCQLDTFSGVTGPLVPW